MSCTNSITGIDEYEIEEEPVTDEDLDEGKLKIPEIASLPMFINMSNYEGSRITINIPLTTKGAYAVYYVESEKVSPYIRHTNTFIHDFNHDDNTSDSMEYIDVTFYKKYDTGRTVICGTRTIFLSLKDKDVRKTFIKVNYSGRWSTSISHVSIGGVRGTNGFGNSTVETIFATGDLWSTTIKFYGTETNSGFSAWPFEVLYRDDYAIKTNSILANCLKLSDELFYY